MLALQRSFTALGLHYGRAAGGTPLLARVMAKAKSIVEGWNGTLHFCYLPEYTRYGGLLPAREPYNASKQMVLETTLHIQSVGQSVGQRPGRTINLSLRSRTIR